MHIHESAGSEDRYICPMRCPGSESAKPGHCPECGMALVKDKSGKDKGGHDPGHGPAAAHDKHAGHSPNMFQARFFWSLAATIPILLYSEMIQEWFGFTMPEFPGTNWIPLVLGSFIFFYGGMVFLRGALAEIRGRQPGMMTLVALAITAAYAYSVATVLFIRGGEFFWELATLVTIMLLGHWVEMRSVQGAQGALKELAKLLPDMAELENGEKVAVSELKTGNIVVVRPGAKVPADGTVVYGESEVNESMLTGESKPIEKQIGSAVIAGTVNGTGVLKIKVTKTGEDTALAGIMRLVKDAQNSRSRVQILADRAAGWLTFAALGAGLLSFFGWLAAGRPLDFALERMVTVLVIACPHALGLAVPLVTAISTTLGAKKGLLVRERMALEAARAVDVVLFDKTGTLTLGQHGVKEIWTLGIPETEMLALAAAAEAHSEHILGKAITEYAKSRNIDIPAAESFRAAPGHGVEAKVRGRNILVGGPQLLRSRKLETPQELSSEIRAAENAGNTVIYVLAEDKIAGAIALADVVRAESKEAVSDLQKLGVRVAMLTGDSAAVARSVAKELGIREFFAEVLPEHKVDKVKELQKDGSSVAMVGDGVNDAPALTQADVGIAIGAGTDVAIESAGIILVKSDPRDVVKVIRLSRATYRKMAENLFWAAGYNVFAIPLAAGALAAWGIYLEPALGAVLMSASTVVVAVNAVLLKKQKL